MGTDFDLLADLVEEVIGTDPHNTDTDGLIDGAEDINGDGVVDEGETNPNAVDTDGDGILDGVEFGLAAPMGNDTELSVIIADADGGNTTTDPAAADTDGAGIPDGEEDLNHNGR